MCNYLCEDPDFVTSEQKGGENVSKSNIDGKNSVSTILFSTSLYKMTKPLLVMDDQ